MAELTNVDVVKQALAALGEEAKPAELESWIKLHHNGREVKNISVTKSNIKKAAAKEGGATTGAKRGRKPGGTNKPAATPAQADQSGAAASAPSVSAPTANGAAIDVADQFRRMAELSTAVKALAGSVGGFDSLRKIVALVEKSGGNEVGNG